MTQQKFSCVQNEGPVVWCCRAQLRLLAAKIHCIWMPAGRFSTSHATAGQTCVDHSNGVDGPSSGLSLLGLLAKINVFSASSAVLVYSV